MTECLPHIVIALTCVCCVCENVLYVVARVHKAYEYYTQGTHVFPHTLGLVLVQC